MTDVQAQVQEVLDELVASGTERGIAAAAYVDGQSVVDAVAGVADATTGHEVTPGTVFYNYSIGKGVMSTLVHQQVDAGLLGYDTRVAEVWPEFAAHGKEAVTVRHVLTHTAGVPGLPADVTVEDLTSWETMTRALEEAEPWWEPGTRVGYHAYTFGYLAGEVVRRVTGRPLAQVLRDDLAAAIGYPDEIFFGMPGDRCTGSRCSRTRPPARTGPRTSLPTCRCSGPPRWRSSRRPRSATTRGSSPRTSRPAARCRRGPSPGCTPRSSTTWTAPGCSALSG